MTTTESRYAPLDLLYGYWVRIDERRGITLFRLGPTHPRARIAGVAAILVLYWALRDVLPPELGSCEFLSVLAGIWLLLGRWNKGSVILAVLENDKLVAGQLPKDVPRQTISLSQIREIEVRDNLWPGRQIAALRQVYLRCKDWPVPMLVYQHWRSRREHVLDVATRLAERWQVRLRVEDGLPSPSESPRV